MNTPRVFSAYIPFINFSLHEFIPKHKNRRFSSKGTGVELLLLDFLCSLPERISKKQMHEPFLQFSTLNTATLRISNYSVLLEKM